MFLSLDPEEQRAAILANARIPPDQRAAVVAYAKAEKVRRALHAHKRALAVKKRLPLRRSGGIRCWRVLGRQ